MSNHAANSGNTAADASGSATLSTPRFCRACAYSLTNHAGPKCPECGREFDPANPQTWDRSPYRRRKVIMWRWVGGLFAMAALAWAFWPIAFVRVTLVAVNKQGNTGATAVAVLGPEWLGVPYYSSATDDPAAAAATVLSPPNSGSFIQFDMTGRDLASSATPSRTSFTIGMDIGIDSATDITVGEQAGTPRSTVLREDRLPEAARFLARQFHLSRTGVSVTNRSAAPQ